MKITSYSKTQPKPPNHCCLGLIFRREDSPINDTRKQLKKKLNFMMLNNMHPLSIIEKSGEQTRRSTFRPHLHESQSQTNPRRVKTIRSQSLTRTPQPIFSPVNKLLPNQLSTSRENHKKCHKSSHSLDRKHQPILRSKSTERPIFPQKTQSLSTATSKQPINSSVDPKQTPSIFSYKSSLQSTRLLQFPSSFKQQRMRIQSMCRDVKASIYYQPQSSRPIFPIKLLRTLQLIKSIPSSQLPNQYAISREPSYDLLDINPEQSLVIKSSQKTKYSDQKLVVQ